MSLLRLFKLLGKDNSSLAEVNSSGEVSTVDAAITNKTQITQITDGTNEATVRLNAQESEGELSVNLMGHLCTDNSSTSNLGIGGIFTGDWEDTVQYGTVIIGITTDQDSATDGLIIQWSSDGSTVHDTDVFSISANSGKVFTFGTARRYVRVVYTNGAVAQTSFALETTLKRVYVKPSSHRIQDSIVTDDDAELVKSVLSAQISGDGFVNIGATESGNLKTTDSENGLAIAKGEVVGTSFIHKFGKAPDFDTADGFVNIWDGANDGLLGGNAMQYTYSTTADIDTISSSSGADTVDIEVQGLDTNYNLTVQTITLTGQTDALLPTALIRVFRMKNVGSTDIAGVVYLRTNGSGQASGVPSTANTVRSIINNGNNQTLMAIFTIPAGKTGYMRDWYASTAGAKRDTAHEIQLYARPFGQVFQLKHDSSIITDGTSYIQHQYSEPEVFAAKTDVHMLADTGQDIAGVSGGFDIVLVDD